MKSLLLLPLLLLILPQVPRAMPPDETVPVVVISHKWYKTRQVIEHSQLIVNTPAPAMMAANKNFERNRRANMPVGDRDPNSDSVDGRSAALERMVQEARANPSRPVNGFAYRAKIQNTSSKVVEIVFWEYQFKESPTASVVTRRQFLCGVNIKPGKEKELQAFSLMSPSDVVSFESVGKKDEDVFQEEVVINRIEFSDGTIWQRPGWHLTEVKLGVQRALHSPWGSEMCRPL